MIKNLKLIIKNVYKNLDNQYARDRFIRNQLKKIPQGSTVLDAGCGDQPYRKYAAHLLYKAQDFAKYKIDEKQMLGAGNGLGGEDGFRYGSLDYIGDIWDINEKNEYFDAILCTEVLEHIPYPIAAIKEFSRLLKKGGSLILTAPSNSLRHMGPFWFHSGFSDRWYERILFESGFTIVSLEPVGDYYKWLALELWRSMVNHNFLVKIILLPAFFYYYWKNKTEISINTLCIGYHVVAKKHE